MLYNRFSFSHHYLSVLLLLLLRHVKDVRGDHPGVDLVDGLVELDADLLLDHGEGNNPEKTTSGNKDKGRGEEKSRTTSFTQSSIEVGTF